jgi:hypothetical protein
MRPRSRACLQRPRRGRGSEGFARPQLTSWLWRAVRGRAEFGELVGRISFFDVRKTTGGRGHGGIVVVSYQVYRSSEAAKSAYEKQMEGLRKSNDNHGSTYRFFQSDISRPHTCVHEGQEYCAAVVGNVTVEALSRIHWFEDSPSRVGSILGPALDHLDRSGVGQ